MLPFIFTLLITITPYILAALGELITERVQWRIDLGFFSFDENIP